MSQRAKRKTAMMTAEVVPGPSTTALERTVKEAVNIEISPEKKAKVSSGESSSSGEEKSPEEIQLYMEETFDIRRTFITMEMPTVATLKETYPQLFQGRQMLAEFQRVTNIDIDHTIQEYCVKYANAIIDIAKHVSGSNPILRQADTIKQQNAALKQYWDMVTALCLVPLLLKENLVEMVREIGEEDTVDPKGKIVPILVSKGPLFHSDEFVLVVEEEIVQEFEEFTIAFATLFASYWVFNMQYPKTLHNTYNFMQKSVLQLRDGSPLPPPCKQLVQRLQKAGVPGQHKGKNTR
ncbi:uncharacterized protein LOC110441729 [Mizuhopecten yessoensis]|uniref:Sterile alpha motif domain-containing protein 3 n=1 Tax=Mizuhopecten yessoensis TaxID=6573 RepID=A0A210PJ01_MIZYE|nr:uncharacterized protein LOC110441729 [Mizuhopecten yessoensis]OWF36396.1 hypothetical protein KP79_PYT03208 [Mizuhopecten yessoensis]